MDEDYWAAYRKRLRERAGRQMFLIIGPVIILVMVAGLLGPTDHPAGDVRDNMAFRLAAHGAFVVFAVVGMVASARWLLADRRKRP